MSQKNMEKRLYVLINKDLDPIYGAVQGGHAVAQWLLDNQGSTEWKNNTLVYLSCNIQKQKFKLERLGVKFSEWSEPDLLNELTAIALINDGSLFKKLELLK